MMVFVALMMIGFLANVVGDMFYNVKSDAYRTCANKVRE